MSTGDDPFGPKKDAELVLELDEGYLGSSRNQVKRSTLPVTAPVPASSDDAFAPAPAAPVQLDVDHTYQTSRKKRATLASHQAFIEETNRRLKPDSYAQQQEATRRLYWRLTRIPVLLVLGWFTLSHLALGSVWVFIDGVNLALHEAGHPMFRWAGDTVYFLGGTIGQLLWPAAFAVYFGYKQRQRFASLACLWWFGENFINIARYVRDAPVMELPLVGGDTHDWNHLLDKWHLLNSADSIADGLWLLGALTMLTTLIYMVWITVHPSKDELAEGFRA